MNEIPDTIEGLKLYIKHANKTIKENNKQNSKLYLNILACEKQLILKGENQNEREAQNSNVKE